MKKTAILLSICLSLTIVLSPLTSIRINASEEIDRDVLTEEAHDAFLEEALSDETAYTSSITAYDNYLTSYFDNLTYNFGLNYKGSCGYVAIGMLLSYYDSHLNDDIVLEQYDIASIGTENNMISRRNSPGTLRDLIVNPSNSLDYFYARRLSANDYYSYVTSMQNISLHSKLISIGASYGYYNFLDDNNPAGTVFYQRYDVLTNYLKNFAGMDNEDYQISYINHESDPSKSDQVRSFAINQVLAGNPVLLSVRGGVGGHVVVAYDYNNTTNELYCHMGWGADKTHVTPESQGFTIYRTALVLSFNTEHSHSLNYGVTTTMNNVPTTSYYCYDCCDIITCNVPNNERDHNFVCSQHSISQHKYECPCGSVNYESHSYTYLPNTKLNHKSLCDECGYYKYEAHITSSGIGGGKTCIKCFALIGSGGIQYNSIGEVVYITDNGSYIRPDGIIVLSEIDTELYLSGELDIDNFSNHNCYTE